MVWLRNVHQSQMSGVISGYVTSVLTNQGRVGFKVYKGERGWVWVDFILELRGERQLKEKHT